MNLNLEVVNKPTIEFWEEVAMNCDYSTFFHTHIWTQILTNTYPKLFNASKGFILRDGTKVILPLIGWKRMGGLFRSYQSMFPAVYGGIIAERILDKKEIMDIYRYVFSIKTLKILVIGNPLFDYELSENFRNEEIFTHILELKDGYKDVYMNFTRGCKSNINKAIRSGITIRKANSWNDWEEYYRLYKSSIKRWGKKATSFYDIKLFKNIFDCKSSKAILWLAELNEKIVSGALIFYHNNHIVYWHGAGLEDYFENRPNNLLHCKVIEDACELKYMFYDFNPSGGHQGVVKFKESFGAKRVKINKWLWEGKHLKILQKLLKRNKKAKIN